MGTDQNLTQMCMWCKYQPDSCPELCKRRLYKLIRHNEIRDLFANLMNEVCHDVEIAPKLQLLQGKTFLNNSATTEDEVLFTLNKRNLGLTI